MNEEKMTVVNAAKLVLEEHNKPLHYSTITNLIMNISQLNGKTPSQTVRVELAKSPAFIRVGHGFYALEKWGVYNQARFAKDIAYDILKKKRKPIRAHKLGILILEERQFKSSPWTLGTNAIHNDARFHYNQDNKLVSLKEWENQPD